MPKEEQLYWRNQKVSMTGAKAMAKSGGGADIEALKSENANLRNQIQQYENAPQQQTQMQES